MSSIHLIFQKENLETMKESNIHPTFAYLKPNCDNARTPGCGKECELQNIRRPAALTHLRRSRGRKTTNRRTALI